MIRAVIFDLDGVLVTTDELHYASWQRLTGEEGIPFDRRVNERLRGIARLASLGIVLKRAPRTYTAEEQAALAERKNNYYLELLRTLSTEHILPGSLAAARALRSRGIRTAIGSSSRNTHSIVAQLGIGDLFDVVIDGNDVTRAKPDPEVFLRVAECLGVAPTDCLVIEDAVAGVTAAHAAGMAVFGIGKPGSLPGVPRMAPNLAAVTLDELLSTPRSGVADGG